MLSKSRTRIISAFPGVGKSYFHKENPETCLDSDSSNFSWIEGTKERNPDFPRNYIEHIKNNIGKYDFILVSSHKEVRKELAKNNLFYYLIYPEAYHEYGMKEEFIERYRRRGSRQEFLTLLEDMFNAWIKDCEQEDYPGCKKICLSNKDDFLTNEIRHIVCSENGEC